MELIFFIAAYMVLWFRFVTETINVTHQCFSCSWTACIASRSFLLLMLLLQWIDLACARDQEGAQPDRWPELTKDILCHIMGILRNKMEGRGFREVGHLLFGSWLGIWWAGLCISCFLFDSSISASLVNLFLFWPTIFVACVLFLPVPLGEKWPGGSMVLSCLPQWSCNNMFK